MPTTKEWYANNKEKHKASVYAYRDANRERIREADRARSAKLKAQLLEYKGGACVDCGNNDPRVLEFDHVPERGPKLFTISTALHSHKQERVIAELDKCDLVCANCHAIRTVERGQRHHRTGV